MTGTVVVLLYIHKVVRRVIRVSAEKKQDGVINRGLPLSRIRKNVINKKVCVLNITFCIVYKSNGTRTT